jgi:hypothetical protein
LSLSLQGHHIREKPAVTKRKRVSIITFIQRVSERIFAQEVQEIRDRASVFSLQMFSEQIVVVVEIRRVSLVSLALSSNSSLFLRLFSSRRNARRAGKNHRNNDDSELEKHFSITKKERR